MRFDTALSRVLKSLYAIYCFISNFIYALFLFFRGLDKHEDVEIVIDFVLVDGRMLESPKFEIKETDWTLF